MSGDTTRLLVVANTELTLLSHAGPSITSLEQSMKTQAALGRSVTDHVPTLLGEYMFLSCLIKASAGDKSKSLDTSSATTNRYSAHIT